VPRNDDGAVDAYRYALWSLYLRLAATWLLRGASVRRVHSYGSGKYLNEKGVCVTREMPSTYTATHRRYYLAHQDTLRPKQREASAAYYAANRAHILEARKARRQAQRLTHL